MKVRVIRGGSHVGAPRALRIPHPDGCEPDASGRLDGFRVVVIRKRRASDVCFGRV